MFENITYKNIEIGANQLEKDGIEKNVINRHLKYWVKFKDGREFPYKELVRTAHIDAFGVALKFKSTERNRSEFFRRFRELTKVEYDEGINFFTKEELLYFHEKAGKDYTKGEEDSKKVRNKIYPIFRKTKVWATEVESRLPNYIKNGRATWQIWNRFRAYSWFKILNPKLNEENVFFTVGVDSGTADEVPLSLVIKIDCQWENVTDRKLPEDITEQFRSFLKARIADQKERFFTIEIDELNNYNWDKLIAKTKEYIEKYESVYEDAVKLVQGIRGNEKRVARICWNDRGWVEPSGPYGKSKNLKTHEGKYGYGHEEWLFDPQNRLDGHQYGFLEPIRQDHNAYQNQKFDIWLYTFNSITKERLHIGELKNVEVLSEEQIDTQASHILNKVRKNYMVEQIIAAEATPNTDSKWNGIDILNIRFKWEDKNILEEPISLSKGHPVWNIHRYTFAQYQEGFELERSSKTVKERFEEHKEPNGSDSNESSTYIRESKQVEIKPVHREISKKLIRILKKKYGNENAKREFLLENGKKVDIAVTQNNEFIFYEIKTYNSVRYSIREAIGQLFEYSYWPAVENAVKMIIVCEPHPDLVEAKEYVAHLRKKLKLEIYLQTFDREKNELSILY